MLYHNWIISWKENPNFKITLRNSERVCNASMNMYYSSSETILRIKTMINQLLVRTGLIMNITYAIYWRKRWLYLSGLVTKNNCNFKVKFLANKSNLFTCEAFRQLKRWVILDFRTFSRWIYFEMTVIVPSLPIASLCELSSSKSPKSITYV